MKRLAIALCLILLLTSSALAVDRLRFGVSPLSDTLRTLKMYKPLADAISAQVGIPVEVSPSATMEMFMGRVKNGEFDIVLASYTSLLFGNAKDYEVFANTQTGGISTARGIVVVRADSGITKLSDLKGKGIGFMDDQAIFYFLGRSLLKANGIDLIRDMTPQFFGKSDAALLAVYNKQIEAASVKDNTITILKDKIDASQLRVLAETETMPTIPLAVKKGLDPALSAKIKAVVLAVPNGDPIWKAQNVDGVVPADAKTYDGLMSLGKRLGLN